MYRHENVNHSIGEYARGETHINTCESSTFRPFIAVHRGVAKCPYTPHSTSSIEKTAG